MFLNVPKRGRWLFYRDWPFWGISCHTRPYNSGSAHSIGTADLAHADGHASALQQHSDAAISPPIVSAYKLQAIAALAAAAVLAITFCA